MTDAALRVAVGQEVEKGRRALQAAEALLKLGLCDDAVTRCYSAAFHFACALLLSEGVEASSHRGVLTLFSQHLVRTGKMSAAAGKDIRRLQGFRESADYDRSFVFTPEGAEEEVAVARRFIAAAANSLQARDWLAPQP